MTLRELLDHMDTTRPSAYTPAQKTAWVSDLEAVIWTQILLQPMSLWHAYDADADADTRLLLPDGWRRVYTAWLDAMIDLANGEYNRYQNSMSLYNACISELGAWYADLYEPAMRPARWTDGVALAYTDLTDAASVAGEPFETGALLAAEWRVTEAFDTDGVLTVSTESGEILCKVYIIANQTDVRTVLVLRLPTAGEGRMRIAYNGDAPGCGAGRLRLLMQPRVPRRSKFT